MKHMYAVKPLNYFFGFIPVAMLLFMGMGGLKGEVPQSKTILLSCPTESPQKFEKVIELAKELGVTAVDLSDLPKDRWQWFDPADPYPNWSMLNPGILKIAPPKELQEAFPQENAKRCRKILAEKGEILRRNGMNGVLFGCEPLWLPESVYQQHPSWRGPRVQAPERSRHNYYPPCVDQPEVLSLYRQATADICKLAPITEFFFFANDSGSGLCWDPGLYPGRNGPEFCMNRSPEVRAKGFLEAIQKGANDAGVDASVKMNEYQLGATNTPAKTRSAGSSNYLWGSKVYPVLGISDPVQFALEAEQVFAHPEAKWSFGFPSLGYVDEIALLREFRKTPITGPLQREQALQNVAVGLVGETNAPILVEAWQQVHEAIQILQQIDNGGPVLLLGSINQRWLNRPLVPFPLELSSGEKDYYRRFQFQAETEGDAANLMNCQGLFLIDGDAGTLLAHSIFTDVIKHLDSARKGLSVILLADPSNDYAQKMDLRLHTLTLVVRNADITARYQCFLDSFRAEWRSKPDHHGYRSAKDGIAIVAEDEVNTRELIELLRSSKIPLIAMASGKEDEDCFTFGPDLIKQLEQKIKTEHNHMPDHFRL